ncbi:MAG: transposase [bacterium]
MINQEKSVDEKVSIVLEILRGEISVEKICQRHQVSITDAYHWCALFLAGAKKAFEEDRGEKTITQEEIEKLKKIIGKE